MIRNLFLAAQLAPLCLTLLLILFYRAPEKTLYRLVWAGTLVWLAALGGMGCVWGLWGAPAVELNFGNIYSRGDYHFPITFFIDRTSMVFLATTAFISALIVKYCRYYLHREAGYSRFFATIFLFIAGMQVLLCAGTLDVLFGGWEIMGISSFLLIGFYRQRQSPVRNALRAYSVYRICDIGLLLGAWFSHLIWHESQTFSSLLQLNSNALLTIGFWPLMGLSFLLLLAASGKSAQFPFSFWLPRAMEGPTPSSAIFYGALSIHAGVFLLLRTTPIWSAHPISRLAVGLIGIVTALSASFSGRVQSNIKAQIGYASISQVGLMLVELSLGLVPIVLFHFVANACLRCYQLLISPSVVAHLLRVQAASPDGIKVSDWSLERRIPNAARSSLYAFAFYESYLEHFLRRRLWDPFNRISARVNRTGPSGLQGIMILLILSGVIFLLSMPVHRVFALEIFFAASMVLIALSALGERQRPYRIWHCIGLSCSLASAAVFATGAAHFSEILVHLSGILPCWILGVVTLKHLKVGNDLDPFSHQGLAETRPRTSFLFFISVIGMSGFPITSAFLGEDLLLHHAAGNDLWLAATITLSFVLNGIAGMRLYSTICWGMPIAAQNKPARFPKEPRRAY